MHTQKCAYRSTLGACPPMEKKLWCTHTLAYHLSSFQMHPRLQLSRKYSLWTDDACLAWAVLSDRVLAFPLQPSLYPQPCNHLHSGKSIHLPSRPTWMPELMPAHAVTSAVAQRIPPKQTDPLPLTHKAVHRCG